ncbi:B3/4 domain-containing protein [Phocaeicola abscessus]|uniref:B3/B4 domain-containing protein n=1 Tax=Phocaeicola abscessus TaxID=555313 RepID=UPI0005578C5E|nr:phenylalanine--tRNA ligase beta subunit-related protein [Phocaeicola abscessus]
MKIDLSDEFEQKCPEFRGKAVYAHVKNSAYSKGLWEEIEELTTVYRTRYTPDTVKEIAPIRATREAYRQCGKDPSRYRPSNEALCRRIVRGLPLYQIDTLVDLINVISLRYGYSIGGFDADKFRGDTLTLGIGKAGEPYEGIGRGMLNIECLPVYRDASGGVGTPTSDHERTKMDLNTTHFLALINGYDGAVGLQQAADDMIRLLKRYAAAKEIEQVDF